MTGLARRRCCATPRARAAPAAGRAPGSIRVSVEIDVVLAASPPQAGARLARFRAARGLDVEQAALFAERVLPQLARAERL